jgi:tetratricopeptide (TPR) repeat protein
MRPFFLVACLAAGSAAFAAPPPKIEKVGADAQRKYNVALARGRKLEDKKDYPGAVAAFQEALTAIPDDPWALSELGWAAYLAKDLALAEKATRQAIAVNGEPNQKGASLYNLGKIEEAKGNKAAAARAYAASLQARPNKTVRAALIALDPAAAAALDPFSPQPMLGPFPTPAAFCAQLKDDDGNACNCAEQPIATFEGKDLAPPYLHAQVLESSCDPGTQEALALETKAGWFVAPNAGERNRGGHCNNQFTVEGIHFENGKKWLVLTDSQYTNCWSNHEDDNFSLEVHAQWQTIVGIGPSGKPSATPRLTVIDQDEGSGKKVRDYAALVGFGDGAIEISGSAEDPALVGKHVLRFP